MSHHVKKQDLTLHLFPGEERAEMTYILRRIEPESWRRVKAKAALDGITIGDGILILLDDWIAGKFSLRGRQSPVEFEDRRRKKRKVSIIE
jgi:hypothetical protein